LQRAAAQTPPHRTAAGAVSVQWPELIDEPLSSAGALARTR
jgi:hypothetical protein